jgi:hypothetical protein
MVLACTMLRKMQNRISYVPFAFVMLIKVLVLLGISSFEVFQGTADKRVVRRVKKKCCFPSLSFPVNRLSSSSSVSLCNFLIIPTALQVGDLVRKHDLRCVGLSLLCRFTNPLKHFCFASDRPTGVLLYKYATGIVPYVVVSKPCPIFQSRYSV